MMPIKQLENYTILLEALLNEFKEKDFITEQFKTVANVEIEIKKLFKSVSENFNINSLRGSAVGRNKNYIFILVLLNYKI